MAERTPYMQRLMTSTYPQIVIEAIQGGFTGSWERLIARRLAMDVERDHSEAVMIVESCGGCFMKAAYLITNSKIPENETQK